jgi:hypothetical protein
MAAFAGGESVLIGCERNDEHECGPVRYAGVDEH